MYIQPPQVVQQRSRDGQIAVWAGIHLNECLAEPCDIDAGLEQSAKPGVVGLLRCRLPRKALHLWFECRDDVARVSAGYRSARVARIPDLPGRRRAAQEI